MRRRWRAILPTYGLLLFSVVSYQSFSRDRSSRQHPGRYFWWGATRLDTDPLGKRPRPVPQPCADDGQGCIEFDPEFPWIVMGLTEKVLILTALPAFFVGMLLVEGLGKLGFNQVWSFMILMPPLIFAWFYFLGWLLDSWRFKRSGTVQ